VYSAPPRRTRPLTVVSLLLAVALLAACNGSTSLTCDALPLDDDRATQLRAASNAVDFEPQLPCSYRDDFEVTRVFDDSVGADPRINFLVSREGERIFIFSQTRGEVPFRAIPRSTHNIAITSGDVTAAGFAGPSQAGDDLAYLRWRVDGITYELAATLTPWFDEADTLDTAGALIAAR